jgi:hypothetical protein
MAYQDDRAAADAPTMIPGRGRIGWVWQDVEDRLVEAMQHWWRSSDSEARFSLGGRISSIWRQAFTDRMALIDQLDMEPTPPTALPLSRGDMARMVEASEWLRFVPEADRRLVILVLVKKAKGNTKTPWLLIWKALGRGRPGPEGLRSRYSRGVTCIANALNSAGTTQFRQEALSTPQFTPSSK